MPMTSSQSTYHITYKSNTFYLFNDALHIEKMHVLASLTIYIIYFEQKLPKTKCYNVICKHHVQPSTNNILFVTNDANCSSYTHHIKELFCLPKEKDMTPRLT